jgi:uncharacterized membrane protein YqaE (UPF0057 family)
MFCLTGLEYIPMKIIRFALGIFLPPVGVFLTYGVSTTLLISILLTILGWVPGSIHAVWAIAKHDEKLALRQGYNDAVDYTVASDYSSSKNL